MNNTRKNRTAVCAIFREVPAFEHALDELKEQGFRQADISVLLPGSQNMNTFAYQKSSCAADGSVIGGLVGILCGALVGWLAGEGRFTIPGLAMFLAAGPLVSAMAVAGIGSALGGIVGALMGWRIPKYEAERYDSYVNEGDILISVHADDTVWVSQAKKILADCGALDIATTKERKKEVPAIRPRSSLDIDPMAQLRA